MQPSGFATWEEALPFALGVARKMARRQPLRLDVDSLVMEALWRAQVSGAVFSRGYVYLRITGAVRDEMRRVAEGQRNNYQDSSHFLDVEDQWSLHDDSVADVVESIDQRRILEALPEAARYLVREALIVGKTRDEMADEFGVSRPAMSQVYTQLRAKPSSVIRLPGTIDLRGELHRAAQKFLRAAMKDDPSNRALAVALEAPKTTAHRWTVGPTPMPKGIMDGKGGPLQAHLHQVGLELARKAFERAKGSIPAAAKLLGVSEMTARRWWRKLPVSAVDRRVRPELDTAAMIALRAQGLTFYEISKRQGCTLSAVKWRLGRAGHAEFEVAKIENGRTRYRVRANQQ